MAVNWIPNKLCVKLIIDCAMQNKNWLCTYTLKILPLHRLIIIRRASRLRVKIFNEVFLRELLYNITWWKWGMCLINTLLCFVLILFFHFIHTSDKLFWFVFINSRIIERIHHIVSSRSLRITIWWVLLAIFGIHFDRNLSYKFYIATSYICNYISNIKIIIWKIFFAYLYLRK